MLFLQVYKPYKLPDVGVTTMVASPLCRVPEVGVTTMVASPVCHGKVTCHSADVEDRLGKPASGCEPSRQEKLCPVCKTRGAPCSTLTCVAKLPGEPSCSRRAQGPLQTLQTQATPRQRGRSQRTCATRRAVAKLITQGRSAETMIHMPPATPNLHSPPRRSSRHGECRAGRRVPGRPIPRASR